MVYRVVLVEYGRVTHSWHYSCLRDAIRQMNFLCSAYDEVNEITPIMVKCSPSEANHHFKGLINNIISK